MKEIKEKLLKDAFSWMFPHTYREINGDFNQYKLMNSASVYEVSTCIKKAIEETSKVYENKLNLLQEQIKTKDEEFIKILNEILEKSGEWFENLIFCDKIEEIKQRIKAEWI